MKKIVLILGFILVGVVAIMLTTDETECCEIATYKKISFNEMEEMIAKKSSSDYLILDVRTDVEYQDGHISGSKLLPDYEIKNIANIEKDKEKLIFVYCRSGNRSETATKKLNELGYQNVYDVGGIIDYKGNLEY